MIRSVLLGGVLLAPGCSSTPEQPADVTFVIQVGDIEIPDTVKANEPLTLRFHGVIGTDLCHRFHRFEAYEDTSNLDLTLWGIFEPSGTCATAIAVLDEVFEKLPPHQGQINLVINQRDGISKLYTIPVID